MRRVLGGVLLCCAVLGVASLSPVAAQTKPEGEMRWALYVTLSPVWFDPGEVVGQITPFWVLYALHDALVKPMPGNLMAPSLAESWTVSADQKVYEFKLREGLRFHNGDPFTAEDVKFSFHRANGPADHPRPGEDRPHLRVHLAERGGAAGGGARPDADQSLSLVGAAGRGAAQAAVSARRLTAGPGASATLARE
jgi:ABC-type transport system substrate-binding protein